MRLVTASEMQELDRITIEEVGIPGVVLMENAGQAVTDAAVDILSNISDPQVIVVAGKGNNGGDGFVVARLLSNIGIKVKVYLLGDVQDVSGDAKINLSVLHKLDFKIVELKNKSDLKRFNKKCKNVDLIIDGVLGTGIEGELRGLAPDLISIINNSTSQVLAIDIPSGLNADTGQAHGIAVKADRTVTFALPKLGLLLYPGRNYVGELEVADISIPEEVIESEHINKELITPNLAQQLLPRRNCFGHKGTFGHAVVIAGSKGMTGAAKLSGLATLKSGAGIVTLGMPESLNSILETKLTEVMTVPLTENRECCLSLNSLTKIMELSKAADVMAVGPGLSQSEEISYIIHDMLNKIEIPLVIDADGLNVIEDLGILTNRSKPTVLTPHPGEMARLTGKSIDEIQANRVQVTLQTAQDLNVTLVLKGAATVVATAKGRVYINSNGNSGMATAGSGDVLTGIITGLIAQGLSADQAATLGVFLHGLTGDLKLEEETTYTLLAGDLIKGLSNAFKYLEE
ncbi:NAD(P)H-hydrate dehydratase [Selenihalanaerobacter shriftii]|uniref:Bifunctional NAD(P)H-hydrate repair enzyme n=1 Tax=Selenihalanaerobacter shriftii TaxID=142842 RepID=A0A1T4JWH6_9FIRM|nr:NAD(P)H-hydrate dehydratase [Selenihalanaerobacter shriftii]SJZ34479.1 NAD(P)H-hydrate epimerase [Selenihalanaerobacter shriftii]